MPDSLRTTRGTGRKGAIRSETAIGPDPGPGAVDLSRRMRRAWVEFVSTGDPGWPAYRPGEALAQVWGVSDAVIADPEAASRRIWRDHRFGAVPSLGSAAAERSTAQT